MNINKYSCFEVILYLWVVYKYYKLQRTLLTNVVSNVKLKWFVVNECEQCFYIINDLYYKKTTKLIVASYNNKYTILLRPNLCKLVI